MTIHDLQRIARNVRRDASREYIRARVTGVAREIKRETAEEIRSALRVLALDSNDKQIPMMLWDGE